jgi:hypothetical protein
LLPDINDIKKEDIVVIDSTEIDIQSPKKALTKEKLFWKEKNIQ